MAADAAHGRRDAPPDIELQAVRALPKVDLHRHVDGAARPGTLLEIARDAGVRLPADTVDALIPHVRVSPGCRSLREFLATFDVFYPVLSLPGAVGRVAREVAEDAAADGVVHLEARFCPALQAGDRQSDEEVVTQVLTGLAAGAAPSGMSWGAIVCCYRSLPAHVNERIVDLALAFAGQGVVGIDLAGPEDLPGAPFSDAIARAAEGGLGVTIHAGEAAGPESVREAVDRLGAQRLGHGVAAARDPALADLLSERRIPLECCLTSNLQTAAVAGLDEHPFEQLHRRGLLVTLNTDDPTVSGITLSGEYLLAARTWGYDLEQLRAFALIAADAAFLGAEQRAALHRRISRG